MSPARRAVRPLAALGVAAGLALSRPAAGATPAQGAAPAACATDDPPPAASAGRGWPAALARTISFHAREISLRDALDRLAAVAGIRLSYSAELLPLGRRVCVSHDSVALGDALTELLRGTAVVPVVAGSDLVVLAPAPAAAAAAEPPPQSVVVLDRVVVTGSPAGAAQRPLAVALGVVDGRELERQAAGTLAQTFDGAVPGVWVWEQSPASLLAQYGSVRGASSFGLSYPKVYIDGIEVANPLLVTQIAPEAIERVEVIRGPQGAALYGADAISGVTNIVTRHDTPDPGAPRARIQSRFGLANSAFVPRSALSQDHSLALSVGSNASSAGLTVDFGSVGEFIPGGYARHVAASGSARQVRSRSILTGTLRFFAERAGAPPSPLLPDAASQGMALGATGASASTPTGSDQSVVQYTLGMQAAFMPTDRWTHTFVAGVDGYTLGGVLDTGAPVPSPVDSALRAARGGADRATFRFSTVGRFDLGRRASATLTLAAEQSVLRQRTRDALDAAPATADAPDGEAAAAAAWRPRDRGDADVAAIRYVDWRSNSGLSAQTNLTLLDRFFLTAGARLERGEDGLGLSRFATLPLLGGAWIGERGPVTLKLRAAYGKGIRWPQTPARASAWNDLRALLQSAYLAPEEQAGVEGGFDLMVGRTLRLEVTRFDQTASGLIQRVGTAGDTARVGRPDPAPIDYVLQNVGRISNRGWEMQGTVERGRLALTGSLALVDSRVQRLADGYTGDLRPGDRMLGVPARTMSLTANWSGSGWNGSVTAYRAADWINYDRLALARACAGVDYDGRDFVGTNLRDYWREYAGITHLRATWNRELSRGLTLTVAGDNLLNRQRGEPDDITVLPGRTLSVGLRAAF